MILYRGDRFVKGKKFNLDESTVTFITKSKKGYIFEDINNKEILINRDRAKGLKEVSSYEKK